MTTAPPTPTSPPITDQSIISAANRGPVTTLFAPPPDCTAALTMKESQNLYFGMSGGYYFDPSCIPFGTKSRDDILSSGWGNYYYSPAICPLDWTIVTTYTSSSSMLSSPGFVTLRPGTTAVLCCPSGYTYGRNGHLCRSTIAQGQSYKYILPRNDGTGSIRGPTMQNMAQSEMTIEGNGVPAWWQQSDEAVLSRASTIVSTSTISPLNTPSTTPRSDVRKITHAGIKIGLGVVIPILVILALVIGISVWRRRKIQMAAASKMSRAQEMPDSMAYVTQHAAPAEVYTAPAEAPSNYHGRHELPDRSS